MLDVTLVLCLGLLPIKPHYRVVMLFPHYIHHLFLPVYLLLILRCKFPDSVALFLFCSFLVLSPLTLKCNEYKRSEQ